MTVYININTQEYPRYQGDIRLIHPEIGEEFVCPPCFVEVKETEQPQPESNNYYVEEDSPKEIDGVWHQQWKQTLLSQEQKYKRDTQPTINPFLYIWADDTKEWVSIEEVLEDEEQ